MTGPVAATMDILLNPDGASVAPDSHAEVDVTFRCETATAVLALFGRLSCADAIAGGRTQVEGEPEHVAAFGRSFPGS